MRNSQRRKGAANIIGSKEKDSLVCQITRSIDGGRMKRRRHNVPEPRSLLAFPTPSRFHPPLQDTEQSFPKKSCQKISTVHKRLGRGTGRFGGPVTPLLCRPSCNAQLDKLQYDAVAFRPQSFKVETIPSSMRASCSFGTAQSNHAVVSCMGQPGSAFHVLNEKLNRGLPFGSRFALHEACLTGANT